MNFPIDFQCQYVFPRCLGMRFVYKHSTICRFAATLHFVMSYFLSLNASEVEVFKLVCVFYWLHLCLLEPRVVNVILR